MANNLQECAGKVISEVCGVVLGKHEEIREVMLTILANGHILLEDIPGVGKTTMAVAFSRAMSLDYKRVQFTPDVMPSDLTGFSIYRKDQEKFIYQPGTVFCNLLLADEINRTSPKTQSALLEVMEERRVTVEGTTRNVPQPFIVIATQNPAGSVGTQNLPEAQVDRFMTTLHIGYPDFDSEVAMAMSVGAQDRIGTVGAVIDAGTLLEMQRRVHEVFIHETVYRYIVSLVTATRHSPYLERGSSPRGTIALVRMARASAWINGRDFVIPDDVSGQFPYVISHRLRLNQAARMERVQREQVISEIISNIRKPSI